MLYSTPFCFVAFLESKQIKVWNYDGFCRDSYNKTKQKAIDYCKSYNYSLEEFGISGVGCVVKY